ncbi:hypothetical protein Tco_1264302 [Tanacetum coccineum]
MELGFRGTGHEFDFYVRLIKDDPHDDAHPEGGNSAKRQKTLEYEAYVSGESFSRKENVEEPGPSTSASTKDHHHCSKLQRIMKLQHYLDQSRPSVIEKGNSCTDEDRCSLHNFQQLSVVRIEVFSLYGYDYMKKIVLHRADLKEYTIAERDFKYLYPSDFKDLYLLNLQGHLNHLPPEDKNIVTTAVNLWTRNLVIRQRVEDFQLGIESYQTRLNLTKPQWDATGFEFKHDFTIHKFSDGTLQQINEALDYRVKEFKVNRMNPGLNTQFWTRKDVDMSMEFMFAIQKRLKTRRIFQNLESFVGGRIKEGDYRLLKRTE